MQSRRDTGEARHAAGSAGGSHVAYKSFNKPFAKVILGREARQSVHNSTAKLEEKAAALAKSITIPSGIEFARFDHAGKTYAISARLVVEVDLLNNRVPDVVLRSKPKRGS